MNISVKYGYYVNGILAELNTDINVDIKYYKAINKLLNIEKPRDYSLTRVGNEYDGGYIMLDDFVTGDKVAYSFGISNDVSWDKHISYNGYDIYMYDHTINNLPIHEKEFHFFKEGLSGEPNPSLPTDTLENFINANGHENLNNMILKVDIEGCEWEFLNKVSSDTLEQFDQILFEFHDIVSACSEEDIKLKLSALKKLNKTHQLIHLHGNNCGMSVVVEGKLYPNIVEATYIKKSKYTTYAAPVFLPIGLDNPCDPGRPDLLLGNWNYD